MNKRTRNKLLEVKELLSNEHITEHTSIFSKFGKEETPEAIKKNLRLWLDTWVITLIDDCLKEK